MARDPASLRKAAAAERFAAIPVIGLVALICWATWAFSPRSGTAVTALDATIRWIGPSNSRTANSRGAPQMALEVETPDGEYLRLGSDSRLVWNCRVGGKIHFEVSQANSGSKHYELAPRPCDS